MRTLFQRPLFLNSHASITSFRHYPTSLLLLLSSIEIRFPSYSNHYSSSSSSSSSSLRHHQEEESRSVKVSVWWDFENCSVPAGVNVYRVGQRIIAALRSSGIKGPVTITAFGDVLQLSRSNQEALSSTGICLAHVPHCGKNSADRSLLLDLVSWVSQNPPPAHLFLISGDRDFANILHRLRMNNYNILLASTDCTSGVLCSAASIMWQWNSLVRGDTLTGKHFNHPPDGVYGSWYGRYKGPLDDPFLDAEQPLLQSENSPEPGIDKPRPIPKALIKRIRQILNSYPDGVTLSELRVELGKTNVTVDKDFFGYKKFSRFLLSIPNVLKLQHHPSGDGQPLVYSIHPGTADTISPSSNPPTRLNMTNGNMDHSSDGLPSLTKSSDLKLKDDEIVNTNSKKSTDEIKNHDLTADSNGALPPPSCRASVDVQSPAREETQVNIPLKKKETQVNSVSDSSPSQQHNFTGGEGFFRRIWNSWFGRRTGNSDKESNSGCGKCSTISSSGEDAVSSSRSYIGSEKRQCKGVARQLSNRHLDLSGSNSISSDERKSAVEEKTSRRSEKNDGKSNSNLRSSDESKSALEEKTIRCSEKNDGQSNSNSGLFKPFVEWLKFWKAREKHSELDSVFSDKSTKADDTGKLSEVVCQIGCILENHELFSKPYFWNCMESFFRNPRGAALITQAITREQLAKELQSKGPSIVKTLRTNHFHQLVHLLISEKRWIEESSSRTFPFKPTLPEKESHSSRPHARETNGLSSMFSFATFQSNIQQLSKQQGKTQDDSHIMNESPINENVNNQQPQNFEELKIWLKKIRNWAGVIDAEDTKWYFEREFNKNLDCGFYGYSSFESLFMECSADNDNSVESNKKASRFKSKLEADCKNLVEEILQEHREKFNIQSFKPLFYKKYGYELDHQKLGHSTLRSLVQKMMPGVKITGSPISSLGKAKTDISEEKQLQKDTAMFVLENIIGKGGHSGDEAAALARRNSSCDPTIDQDSIWEELGPVTKAVRQGSGSESGHDDLGPVPGIGNIHANGMDLGYDSEGSQEISNQKVLEKPSLSDEDFSDSDREDITTGAREEKCSSVETSPLLEVLNSWYQNKDSSDKDDVDSVDGLVDCSRSKESSKRSESSAVGAGKVHTVSSCRAKPRHCKNFSFVSDPPLDSEETKIDSILGTLRKSTDLRMKS